MDIRKFLYSKNYNYIELDGIFNDDNSKILKITSRTRRDRKSLTIVKDHKSIFIS